MRRIASLLIALTCAVTATTSSATVLTFEDLNVANPVFEVMPAPYAGLTFSGWFYGVDTVYTPASGVIDLFTDFADPNDPGNPTVTDANNVVTSAMPFTFVGASFSGYSGVTFELYFDGQLVHVSDTLPDAAGPDPYLPTFLASGYSGLVDKVVVSGVQGYYSMDDFSFSLPMPSTIGLVGLGVIATSVRRRTGVRQSP